MDFNTIVIISSILAILISIFSILKGSRHFVLKSDLKENTDQVLEKIRDNRKDFDNYKSQHKEEHENQSTSLLREVKALRVDLNNYTRTHKEEHDKDKDKSDASFEKLNMLIVSLKDDLTSGFNKVNLEMVESTRNIDIKTQASIDTQKSFISAIDKMVEAFRENSKKSEELEKKVTKLEYVINNNKNYN